MAANTPNNCTPPDCSGNLNIPDNCPPPNCSGDLNVPNNCPPPDCLGDLNIPEEFSPPKELLLASQLKQTDEFIKEDGVTQIAYVVSFFRCSKCIKFSADYNPCIDLNLLVRHIFSPDQWWANRTLLLDALRDFGKLFGFHPVVKHNNLQCNRYRKKEYSHSFQSGQLKRECTFNLNIKAYYNPKSVPKTNIANGKETKQVIATVCPDWTNLTCIMSSCCTCYDHGGGCSPSPHNFLVT